jgi:hypothetical protein
MGRVEAVLDWRAVGRSRREWKFHSRDDRAEASAEVLAGKSMAHRAVDARSELWDAGAMGGADNGS